jgi:hypothetical protein
MMIASHTTRQKNNSPLLLRRTTLRETQTFKGMLICGGLGKPLGKGEEATHKFTPEVVYRGPRSAPEVRHQKAILLTVLH